MATYYQTIKSYDKCEPDEHNVLNNPASVEMHFSSYNDLVKRFGRKIKAAGGTYTACRGRRTTRTVCLSLRDDTRALINALVNAYGGPKTPMIARGTGVRGSMAWMDVHYVHKNDDDPVGTFLGLYWQAVRQAMDRGICNIHEGTPPEPDHLLYARRRQARADERVNAARDALAEAKAAQKAAYEEVWRLEKLGE